MEGACRQTGMVTFRCLQSGNKVSFTNETDIESMRKEPHYEEVKDEKTDATAHEKNAETVKTEILKRRGRPKVMHIT